jgi:hypothetical protein
MKKFNLDDLKKETDLFQVPDKYFDTLPTKIQAKINTKKQKTWYQNMVPRFAFSVTFKQRVAICGLVLMGWIGVQFVTNKRNIAAKENLILTTDLAEVSETAIQGYLLENGVGMDEIVSACTHEQTYLNIDDGLPADISNAIFEAELNPEDLEELL